MNRGYERVTDPDLLELLNAPKTRTMGIPEGMEKVTDPAILAELNKDMPAPVETKPWWTGPARTVLETAGTLAGATVGGASGLLTGPGAVVASPVGAVVGGGFGYAGAKSLADLGEEWLGYKKPTTLLERSVQTAKDIGTGAMMEAGGQVAGKVIPPVVSAMGKGARAIHGRLTGAGTGATEEAIASGMKTGLTKTPLKSATAFDRALRGKISGEEVVENTKNALQTLKDQRAAEYLPKLQQIRANQNTLNGVKQGVDRELQQLMAPDEFQIVILQTPKGPRVDFSQSPLVKNQLTIKKAITDVTGWADNSPAGLDVLKKRLAKYVDQVEKGSPAEAFLTRLESNLNDGLKRAIPEYAEMTKGYAEATKLIKDIESGLMLRKQGISGRIVADQTLRRLLSSMRDNFVLRRDLVNILSNKSGQDLPGQIAGYAMRSPVPLGLAGTGPAILGEVALARYVNPQFWPILLASSPRVSAEFLRMFGKFAAEFPGTTATIGKAGAYAIGMEKGQQ